MLKMKRNIVCASFCRMKKDKAASSSYSTHSYFVCHSQGGPVNFQKDYERTHLKTSAFQKSLLALGSGIISLSNPSRGDMIAVMGETTGASALGHVRTRMLESAEGRKILEEKPRINSSTVNLSRLKSMPEGTLGKAYSNFLEKYQYTPDTRLAVRFIDDIELAYVIQRYREVHDLFHTILDMPTNMLGEVTVKWVEAIQTRLPMCAGGALFGAARLAPKFTRTYSTKKKIEVMFDESLIQSLETRELKPDKHPGRTKVPTVKLPEDIQKVVTTILSDVTIDLDKDSQKLVNHIENRRPPPENNELEDKYQKVEAIFQRKYSRDEEATLNGEETMSFRRFKEEKMGKLMRGHVFQWKPLDFFNFNLRHAYLFRRSPAEYAVLISVFSDISKRDPNFSPKNLFDFGSGIGTVTWAAKSLWRKTLKEFYCVDICKEMHDIALLILQKNNPEKTLLGLYQRQFLPASISKYDIVVSSYSLMELPNSYTRLETILNLWNRTKEYLVIIEHGNLGGFRLVEEAREFVIYTSKKNRTECHVFAPCSHEFACPKVLPATTFPACKFFVGYHPLNLKNKGPGNALKERYSYVVIKKGQRPAEDPQWPRIVDEVLLRHKHTICRVCTASGKLEEVIISPAKQGKMVYKCSRHCKLGDLLPGRVKSVLVDSCEDEQTHLDEVQSSDDSLEKEQTHLDEVESSDDSLEKEQTLSKHDNRPEVKS